MWLVGGGGGDRGTYWWWQQPTKVRIHACNVREKAKGYMEVMSKEEMGAVNSVDGIYSSIFLEMLPSTLDSCIILFFFNTEGGGAGVFESGAADNAVELFSGQGEVQDVGLEAVSVVVFLNLELIHAHKPAFLCRQPDRTKSQK